MVRSRRSMTVVLAALAAVSMILVGTTVAAGGWGGRPPTDRSAPGPVTTQQGVALASGAAAVVPGGADQSGASPMTTLPPPPDAARDPAVAARAGEVVARGSDLTVERVDLGAVTTVDVAGEARDVTAVYRVVVTAGPFQLRAMPAVLSVNGLALGGAAESEDLESLVLYTYDDLVTTPGATMALSYGLPGVAAAQWSTIIEAPQ